MYLRKLRNNCQKCGGVGYFISDDECQYSNCECTLSFERNLRYLEANIQADYLEISDDEMGKEFIPACFEAFKNLRENIVEFSKNLNLLVHKNKDDHSYGTSTVGFMLLKEMVRLKYDCYAIPTLSLMDTFFDFSTDEETNNNRLAVNEFLTKVPVLLIDDFNDEFSKKNDKTFIYNKFLNFLSKRLHGNKFTIITSNFDYDTLLNMYVGGVANCLKQHYLPFNVICHTGKYKRRALVKAKNSLSDNMKMLLEYVDAGTKETAQPTHDSPMVKKQRKTKIDLDDLDDKIARK
jgi:DNA replication protein DnaC